MTDILLTDKSGLVSPLHIIDDNNNITGYPNLYPHENNILAGISSASKASFFTLANGDYTLTVCSALSRHSERETPQRVGQLYRRRPLYYCDFPVSA